MTLKQHAIQASIGSAILAPFLGIDVAVFFLSVILIDIDHYFEFALVCGRFGIKDMFRYYDWILKENREIYGLSIFHTAEIFLLLFALGFWSHYFWLVLFGFSAHLVFDFYHLYMHNHLLHRAFSIIEYIIKSKGVKCHPVPEKEFWENVKNKNEGRLHKCTT